MSASTGYRPSGDDRPLSDKSSYKLRKIPAVTPQM